MLEIQKLSSQSAFYGLTYTEKGGLQNSFFTEIFLENCKGFFGYTNHANPKLIAFHALRLLKEIPHSTLTKETKTVIQFAMRSGLLPSTTRKDLEINPLIEQIALNLLQDQSKTSFQDLIPAYRQTLEKAQLLKPDEFIEPKKETLSPEKTEEITNLSSWTWGRIALISLVAVAGIALASHILTPPPLEMNPFKDEPADLNTILAPLCDTAVRERKTADGTKRLRDFLPNNWQAYVFTERTSSSPLCLVTLSKPIFQTIVQHSPDGSHFEENYGKTCALIPEKLRNHPVIQWVHNNYPSSTGVASYGLAKDAWMCFKSHIYST